jgi:hypothetical protein
VGGLGAAMGCVDLLGWAALTSGLALFRRRVVLDLGSRDCIHGLHLTGQEVEYGRKVLGDSRKLPEKYSGRTPRLVSRTSM